MTLIKSIQMHSAKRQKFEIQLASAFSPPFSRLYQVDSFNLIVGTNGEGKTTVLTELAEALSNLEHYRESYRDERDVGIDAIQVGLEDAENSDGERRKYGSFGDIGVVFYTPLPYRREMRRSRYLRDASPTYSQKATEVDPDIFREVASKLGIQTALRGRLAFSPSWITNTIALELIEPFYRRAPLDIAFCANQWEEARGSLRAAEAELENSRDDDDRRIASAHASEAGKRFRQIQHQFSDVLFSYFQDRCPFRLHHPLLALAVFEWMARSAKDKTSLTRAFLELMELAEFSPPEIDEYDAEKSQLLTAIDSHFHLLPLQQIDRREFSYDFSFREDRYNEFFALEKARRLAIRLFWTQLPSGLIALLDQFSRIQLSITELVEKYECTSVILLIDEGEAYLHMDWQRRYVKLLDEFLGAIKKDYAEGGKRIQIQVVVATHSVILAGDFPTALVTNLSQETPDVRTFAAPLDQLAFRFFGSYSIGEFATQKISELYRRIESRSHTEDDLALIEQIGDGGIRNALIRALNDGEERQEERP